MKLEEEVEILRQVRRALWVRADLTEAGDPVKYAIDNNRDCAKLIDDVIAKLQEKGLA